MSLVHSNYQLGHQQLQSMTDAFTTMCDNVIQHHNRNKQNDDNNNHLNHSPLVSIIIPESSHPPVYREQQDMSFSWLPADILEKICFMCDAPTLLAVSSTCKRLKAVADGDRVWRRLILKEMKSWRSLRSATMPGHQQLFFNVKATYLACSPQSHSPLALPHKQHHSQPLWKKMYLSFGGQKRKKIVMFGAGLEHGGKGLVVDMFYSDHSPFSVQGLVPGIIAGTGGGVSLRHKEMGTNIDMVALYHRRTRKTNDPIPESSRKVCADADAFICVVDDTMLANPALKDVHEHDLLDELQSLLPKSAAPLLVVTCAPGFSSGICLDSKFRRSGTVDVANSMRLGAQTRPWAVEALALGNQLQSMSHGIEWLLCNCNMF